MGPFKGEVPVFARLWPIRVRVSFTTGAVWLAILATAGILVMYRFHFRFPKLDYCFRNLHYSFVVYCWPPLSITGAWHPVSPHA